MADLYDPRWAEDGDRVEPSSSVKEDGFPCGSEGLRETLNWLFWSTQGSFNTLWGRTIASGAGLNGGGDLSSDRTIATDWSSGLSNIPVPASNDLLNVRDVSEARQGRMTLSTLREWILEGSGETIESRLISTDDGLSGGGDLSADRTLVTNWSNGLAALAGANMATGDLLNIRDVSANEQKAATLDELLKWIVTNFINSPGSLDVLAPDVMIVEAVHSSGDPAVVLTDSFTAWYLNSVALNQISGASLNPGTNYIQLPAGRYRATYSGVARSNFANMSRLYNRTAGLEISRGLQVDSDTAAASLMSAGVAFFTLSGTSNISLDHKAVSTGGSAFFGDGTDTAQRRDAYIIIEKIKGAS